MSKQHPDSKVIDKLGGTSATAVLCDVKPPSVSEWREKGIPKSRRMFLRLARPDAFEDDAAPKGEQHA